MMTRLQQARSRCGKWSRSHEIFNDNKLAFGREKRARLAQNREEDELMGVVRGRAREGLDLRGEQVGVGAVRAPGGEAGGDVLVFEILHGALEGGWVLPVDEHAGVGGLELVLDGLAAASHLFRCWIFFGFLS